MSRSAARQTDRPSREERIKVAARDCGFVDCGIMDVGDLGAASDEFRAFLDAGFHGEMTWLAETADRRAEPTALWSGARSAIVVAQSYAPGVDPMTRIAERGRGVISAYAKRRDYHDVLKGRLKHLAQQVVKLCDADVKVFVDTAPLLEKPIAARAGLGWQGKQTVLISHEFGAWLLLGVILTNADLTPDAAGTESCGTCTRCIDVCPTDALPAPFRIDARKCLAYLTIEHAGPIDEAYRKPMGNRVFGCDDCLAVCPWNKFAEAANDTRMAVRGGVDDPPLRELLQLDDAAFRAKFAGTPVKRTGHARFLRNVLIAAGNARDPELAPLIEQHLSHDDPRVRGMAVWAVDALAVDAVVDKRAAIAAKLDALARDETDSHVREELAAARSRLGVRERTPSGGDVS